MGVIYFPNSIEHVMSPLDITSEGLSSHEGTHNATAQTSLARKQARTITPADAIESNSDPVVRTRWMYLVTVEINDPKGPHG